MKGELGVWDLEESEYVVKHFQGQEAYNALKQQEKDAGIEGRLTPEPAADDDDDSEDYEDMDEEPVDEEEY